MNKPLSTQNLTRILVAIVIGLALLAGFYESLSTSWQKKYNQLQRLNSRTAK